MTIKYAIARALSFRMIKVLGTQTKQIIGCGLMKAINKTLGQRWGIFGCMGPLRPEWAALVGMGADKYHKYPSQHKYMSPNQFLWIAFVTTCKLKVSKRTYCRLGATALSIFWGRKVWWIRCKIGEAKNCIKKDQQDLYNYCNSIWKLFRLIDITSHNSNRLVA